MDTGDTAWVLTSAALVLLMTPGLALFYGGMVRAKSVLNMMMMSFGALALISVLWVLYGYSLAFGDDVVGGLFGNPFEYFGLEGLMGEKDRWSRDQVPSLAFVGFQAVFAIITVALISGRDRRPRPVRPLAAVLRHLGHDRLLPGRALGLRVRRHHRVPASTGGWIANTARRDRLRRRHRGAHQRRRRGPRAGHRARQAGRLEARPDAAAQPAAGDDRRRPAVVRLVRLQRRLRAAVPTRWPPVAWVNTMVRHRRGRPRLAARSRGSGTVMPPRWVPRRASSRVWSRSPRPAPRSTRSARSSSAFLAGVLCALAVGLKFRFGFDDSLDVVGVHLVGGLWGTLAVGLLATANAPAGVDGLLYGGGARPARQAGRRRLRGADLLVRADARHRVRRSRRPSASDSTRRTRSRASTVSSTPSRRTTSPPPVAAVAP